MGKLILYGFKHRPTVRAVLLTLHALNLPFEYRAVNLLEGEQKLPEFLRINPLATVPVLDDDGHKLTNSHAIIAYLASKYDKTDSLYPKDLVKRSLVDERLYYESAIVFERTFLAITTSMFVENIKDIPQKKIDNIAIVYGVLNDFLKDKPYIAGDHLTIADFSLVASITSLPAFLAIDAFKYPQLVAWIKRLEKLPYYEDANAKGLKDFKELIKSQNIKIVPH